MFTADTFNAPANGDRSRQVQRPTYKEACAQNNSRLLSRPWQTSPNLNSQTFQCGWFSVLLKLEMA
jgi:hypothetical protein